MLSFFFVALLSLSFFRSEGAINTLRPFNSSLSAYNNKTFTGCFLIWGDFNDKSYSQAQNEGRLEAYRLLKLKYPNIDFEQPRFEPNANVAASNATKQREQISNILFKGGVSCNYLYVSYTDFAPRELIAEFAQRHPNILFVIGTAGAFNTSNPRNVIAAEPLCDREWYLAGYMLGLVSRKCVVLVSPFADTTMYLPHAFAAGVRRANASTRPIVIPMNSWSNKEKDAELAPKLFSVMGCDAAAQWTNSDAISSEAARLSHFTVGWEYDRSTVYAEAPLTSVVRTFDDEIFSTIEFWLFNQTNGGLQSFGCELQNNKKASSFDYSLLTTLQQTLNVTEEIWGKKLFDQNGVLQSGPLYGDTRAILQLNFTTNFSILAPPYYYAKDCKPGTTLREGRDGNLIRNMCEVCPVDTKSTGGSACTPCDFGLHAPEGSSECTGFWSTERVLAVALGITGLIAVIFAIVCLIHFFVLKKKSQLKSPAHAHEPASDASENQRPLTLPSMNSLSTKQELQQPSLAMSGLRSGFGPTQSLDSISREEKRSIITRYITENNFYIGALFASELQAQLYKVVLASGTTICMKERFGMTREDAAAGSLVARIPSHPNVIDHYHVEFSPTAGSTRIFMEFVSGTTLKDIVDEVGRPLADMTTRCFAQQIAHGLAFLHDQKIVHRFLSPETVLIDANGTAKLSNLVHAAREIAAGADESLTVIEAPQNQPPEVLTGAVCGDAFSQATKADVWAMGIVVARMHSQGRGPWPHDCEDNNSIIRFLQSDEPIVVPPNASLLAQDFLRKCLVKDPSQRCTARELANHRWLLDTSEGSTAVSTSSEVAPLVPVREASRFTIGPLLGMGAFGTVYEATVKATREVVAVKVIHYDARDNNESSKVRRLMREISLMKEFEHNRIVRYKFLERSGDQRGPQSLFIVMEYVPGGTLKQHLMAVGPLADREAAKYVRQMLEGLSYLHGRGVTHRDIKPSNCLLTAGGDLKVADFGTATRVHTSETISVNMQGTLLYMAPEIMREERPATSADIWSVGASAMELLTGCPPWSHAVPATSYALISFVASSDPLVFPTGLSAAADAFLRRALCRDPTLRPSADELLSDAWLAEAP